MHAFWPVSKSKQSSTLALQAQALTQTPPDVTSTVTTKGLGIVSDLDKVAALVMTMLVDNTITEVIYMSVRAKEGMHLKSRLTTRYQTRRAAQALIKATRVNLIWFLTRSSPVRYPIESLEVERDESREEMVS